MYSDFWWETNFLFIFYFYICFLIDYVADITGVYIFKDISIPCYKRSHVINSFDGANITKLP